MKKERIRSKRGFKGLGSFILGWFVGLVSTFAILFGVGYWAYSSISVRKIEKWTKTEITDNKGVESLTLKKAVGIIQGIADNGTDAYTLAQLEEDFNVKLLGDKIFGISTDIIKNSPITELKQALNDTIDTATFNNVLNFLDINQDELGLLNTVLESDLTYYVYNGKLYTNEEYTIEVGFKYTIENNTVEFANGTHTISSNSGVQTIKPRLSDLPLNTALSSMTDATKGLKIYEILDYDRTGVEGNYTYTDKGNEVSGIMASLAEYTIDDLSDKDKFNNIYIYEVMGYKLEDNGNYTYINENNEKVIVTGTMKTLAGKTIGDMSNPDTINNLYVYEVMGYERTGEDPNYIYKENNNEVTGIMATLAGKKISELDDAGAFNDVTVADAMGYTIVEGVVYDSNDNVVEGLFAHIADAKVSGLSSRINTLELGQVLDIELDEANGIIKALHGTKVEDLSKEETINNIYIYQVMDYYKNGDKYYETYDKATDTYSDEVTGVMKALAGKMVGELDDETTGINSLTLGEILDVDKDADTTPAIIKALYSSKLSSLNSDIADLQIYKVMGYYENGGKYYETYDEETNTYTNEVTGIMGAIASSNVNGLDTTIETLRAVDVFGSDLPILKLFTTDELNGTGGHSALTVMQMPTAVVNKINHEDTTIGTLIDAGVLVVTDDNGETVTVSDTIRNMTISQLIQYVMEVM